MILLYVNVWTISNEVIIISISAQNLNAFYFSMVLLYVNVWTSILLWHLKYTKYNQAAHESCQSKWKLSHVYLLNGSTSSSSFRFFVAPLLKANMIVFIGAGHGCFPSCLWMRYPFIHYFAPSCHSVPLNVMVSKKLPTANRTGWITL